MAKVVTGNFTADGNAYDLNLGFVPQHIRIQNLNAGATEVFCMEWYQEMGDGNEIQYLVEGDASVPGSGDVAAYSEGESPGNQKSCVFDFTGGTYEDMITVADGHGFENNERVVFVKSGGLATGLSEGVKYYVIVKSPTIFQVSLTKDGAVHPMTSDGTAPNYVASYDKQEPVRSGGHGVTIGAGFMDDGDSIYFTATQADRDFVIGDVG